MGRGSRAEASKTAQGLLFGPRHRQGDKDSSQFLDQIKIDQAISHMEKEDDVQEALQLLIDHHDKQPNLGLTRLAEEMDSYIMAISDRDQFNYLCASIAHQIDRGGKIPALELLKDTLDEAISRNARQGGPTLRDFKPTGGQMRLVTRDHDLSRKLLATWAEENPVNLLTAALNQDNDLSDKERATMRQAAYKELADAPSRSEASGVLTGKILCHEDILTDLANGNNGSQYLADEIIDDCRYGGGRTFFSIAADDDLRKQLFSSMTGKNRLAAKDALSEYAKKGKDRDKIDDANEQLFQSVAILPSNEDKERLYNYSAGLATNWPRLTIKGEADEAIKRYKDNIAGELVAYLSPEDVNQQLPLLANNYHISQDFEEFREQHLSRPLLPDRKIDINADDWRILVKNSLIPDTSAGVFGLKLSGTRLVKLLGDYYQGRGLA